MADLAHLSVRTRRLPRRFRAGFLFSTIPLEIQVSRAQAQAIMDDPELEAAMIGHAPHGACEAQEDHGATHTAQQARKRSVNACERLGNDAKP